MKCCAFATVSELKGKGANQSNSRKGCSEFPQLLGIWSYNHFTDICKRALFVSFSFTGIGLWEGHAVLLLSSTSLEFK